MARFNEINVGRFNRALQKLTGIKGFAPSPQLASEIMPTLNMFRGAEDRFIESWQRWAALFGVNAVAAQFGQAQIRNPLTSNVIGVIEKVWLQGNAGSAANVGVLATNADNTTLITPRPLDGRQPQPNASLITSSQTAVGGSSASVYQFPALTGSFDMIVTDEQEIVLTPGQALFIQQATVNIGLLAVIWWRERFLEDSERTG